MSYLHNPKRKNKNVKCEFFTIIKKTEKNSKKVLTKQISSGIIVKLSPRGKPLGNSERSLKIEQQEIESTKRTKKDACTEVSLILKLENILKKQ